MARCILQPVRARAQVVSRRGRLNGPARPSMRSSAMLLVVAFVAALASAEYAGPLSAGDVFGGSYRCGNSAYLLLYIETVTRPSDMAAWAIQGRFSLCLPRRLYAARRIRGRESMDDERLLRLSAASGYCHLLGRSSLLDLRASSHRSSAHTRVRSCMLHAVPSN